MGGVLVQIVLFFLIECAVRVWTQMLRWLHRICHQNQNSSRFH